MLWDTKLTDATKLSARQGEAFINKSGGFSARTKNPQNIYDLNIKYKKEFENITTEPTFIKCFDKTDGSEIEDFKLITNTND